MKKDIRPMSVAIAGRRISKSTHPYIIAEMSANHNGSIETACKIISAAKESGADAVKLQSYRPDTITLDADAHDFLIENGLWKGKRLYDLYQEAHMPWEWHKPLFEFAKDTGITIFSSPFDSTAVDLLEDLNAPAYKIASFEAIDLPLIRYVASTRKPLIISTGLASLIEIREALEVANEAGAKELVLLHCVSGYPAPARDYNLSTLSDMAARFNVLVGLSDHTLSNTTAIASVALGAVVIEKHFTLDRLGGGPDDSFSLEPDGLKDLCERTREAWESVGEVQYELKSSERDNVKFRRSLYVTKNVKAGDVFSDENVASIRPGYGLAPKHLPEILGRRAVRDLSYASALSWADIEQ